MRVLPIVLHFFFLCLFSPGAHARIFGFGAKSSSSGEGQQSESTDFSSLTGNEAYTKAQTLVAEKKYEMAALAYWAALMKGGSKFTVEDAFAGVLQSFKALNKVDEGFMFIADQYAGRKQIKEAMIYYEQVLAESLSDHSLDILDDVTSYLHTQSLYSQALQTNPNNTVVLLRMAELASTTDDDTDFEGLGVGMGLSKGSGQGLGQGLSRGKQAKLGYLAKAFDINPRDAQVNLHLGNYLFELKQWTASIEHLQAAYFLDETLTEAASSVAYLRSSLCMWGKKGTQYQADMDKIKEILRAEEKIPLEGPFKGGKLPSSAIHPHMTLAYPLSPKSKLRIAQSHAKAELELVYKSGLTPYNHSTPEALQKFQKQSKDPLFRIRIGYASANIKSKTTAYMAQDLMRFHSPDKFEIFVYATTSPDHPTFLTQAMQGIDWRKKIELSVGSDHFYDTSALDVLATARLIHSHGIHILINWDGYSNNGVRAAGLFPLHAAPIQVAHQEYIGTMGADYIQYLIADPIAIPPKHDKYYSEKFLYLPHSFLANSFVYMQSTIELAPPSLELPMADNPSSNRCGLGQWPTAEEAFVYCNFNKHLKFDPTLFTSWLATLQAVPRSLLCLLENPADSIPYITEFVKEYDPSLVDRIGYLPFHNNPFENQKRNARYCHVVLDTTIYNGHTTAVDALYGAVPVITRNDQKDMSGRVGTSVLTALGVSELITTNARSYQSLAIRLANDAPFYQRIRSKLVDAATAIHPRNPYWDLRRYVKNLEKGFEAIWDDYLTGQRPRHIYVTDDYLDREGHLEEEEPILGGDYRNNGRGGKVGVKGSTSKGRSAKSSRAKSGSKGGSGAKGNSKGGSNKGDSSKAGSMGDRDPKRSRSSLLSDRTGRGKGKGKGKDVSDGTGSTINHRERSETKEGTKPPINNNIQKKKNKNKSKKETSSLNKPSPSTSTETSSKNPTIQTTTTDKPSKNPSKSMLKTKSKKKSTTPSVNPIRDVGSSSNPKVDGKGKEGLDGRYSNKDKEFLQSLGKTKRRQSSPSSSSPPTKPFSSRSKYQDQDKTSKKGMDRKKKTGLKTKAVDQKGDITGDKKKGNTGGKKGSKKGAINRGGRKGSKKGFRRNMMNDHTEL